MWNAGPSALHQDEPPLSADCSLACQTIRCSAHALIYDDFVARTLYQIIPRGQHAGVRRAHMSKSFQDLLFVPQRFQSKHIQTQIAFQFNKKLQPRACPCGFTRKSTRCNTPVQGGLRACMSNLFQRHRASCKSGLFCAIRCCQGESFCRRPRLRHRHRRLTTPSSASYSPSRALQRGIALRD